MKSEIIKDLLALSSKIKKFVNGLEGNISGKVDSESFLIKCSGKSLIDPTIDDFVLCDKNGVSIEENKKPSIEVSFHSWLLSHPNINYVAHTHPVNTLKILCSNKVDLFSKKRIFPDQVVFNGVESCVVEYFHPGIELTDGIKKSVNNYISNHKKLPEIILLKNHGIITLGKTIKDCIVSTEICEKAAEIFTYSSSDTIFLDESDITKIIEDDKENLRKNI